MFLNFAMSMSLSFAAHAAKSERPPELDLRTVENNKRYVIVAESQRVRDLSTGREFYMEVPAGARNGDVFDVELNRDTSNPGIETRATKEERVRDQSGREYNTKVPANAKTGDWIIYKRR